MSRSGPSNDRQPIRRASIVLVLVFCTFMVAGTAHAGAWTLKKGHLWIKSALLYQKTSDQYYSRNTPCPLGVNCTEGQRVDFPFDGESELTAVFVDVHYGLFDPLEIYLQVPFFDIQFTDLASPQRPGTSDIGDVRFGVKYRFLATPLVASLSVQAKAPTGFLNKDAEIIPVGDGQWDLELIGQFGKSLWPVQSYLNLDLGYRIRFAPALETSSVEPGNEFFFRGEAGYNVLENLVVKFALSGLYGDPFKNHSFDTPFDIPESEREVLYVEPGISLQVVRGLAFETSVQVSVSGKNYLAGEVFNVGVSYKFSLLR